MASRPDNGLPSFSFDNKSRSQHVKCIHHSICRLQNMHKHNLFEVLQQLHQPCHVHPQVSFLTSKFPLSGPLLATIKAILLHILRSCWSKTILSCKHACSSFLKFPQGQLQLHRWAPLLFISPQLLHRSIKSTSMVLCQCWNVFLLYFLMIALGGWWVAQQSLGLPLLFLWYTWCQTLLISKPLWPLFPTRLVVEANSELDWHVALNALHEFKSSVAIFVKQTPMLNVHSQSLYTFVQSNS